VAIKRKFRKIILRRMGLSENDIRKDIRICNKHETEKINEMVEWTTVDDEEMISDVDMFLPLRNGRIVTALTQDSINCNERYSNREIADLKESAKKGDADAALKLVQRLGIIPQEPTKFRIRFVRTNQKRAKVKEKAVVVRLQDLNDTLIKIQTGFPSLLSLLGFIAVVCEGEIKTITRQSTSTLTFFEEWYMFFEVVYGRTLSRWIDTELKYLASRETL
jgi:hypothetical protein